MAESSCWRRVLVALLLSGVALALYAPTTSFGFVEYDDPAVVGNNPHLAQGLTAESLRWAFTSLAYADNWHPLTWLSHGLDLELFGLDPGKHHAVNALLHALNAALLFFALAALTGRGAPSAGAAALFALHPLRVESVAWIAERKDVLSATFFALTLLAYARYARAPSRARLSLVALALGIGLLAKPTLVTLPCLLLVLDAWPLGRGREATPFALVREKLPLFALTLGSCVLTLLAQHAGGALNTTVALPARLANALLSTAIYLGQFLCPRGLAFFYPHPALVAPEVGRLLPALAALALLGALSALAFVRRRREPWLLVGWLWFLGTLVPMIGLVQVGDLAHADRYTYLASIGLELALVWSGAELVVRLPSLRPFVVTAFLLLLLGCGVLSARQLRTWRDSRALAEHALAVTEKNFVAHNLLGQSLGAAGELDLALEHFEAACAIRPGFFEAELNAGKARYRKGEFSAARDAFERALWVRPASGEGRLCLAVTLANLGELERAGAELDAALRREPDLASDPRVLQLRANLDARKL